MNEERKIPIMLTVEKTAEKTGLSKYRVRQLCKEKKIVSVLCGNKYLINLDRLIDYLNSGDQTD